MSSIGISFDAELFAREFIGRRARRWLKQFLDGIGKENLIFIMSQNKNLVDYIPPEEKYVYKSFMQPYRDYALFFTNDDVYSWIPADWRDVIEAETRGKQWVSQQLPLIRSFLFPS